VGFEMLGLVAVVFSVDPAMKTLATLRPAAFLVADLNFIVGRCFRLSVVVNSAPSFPASLDG